MDKRLRNEIIWDICVATLLLGILSVITFPFNHVNTFVLALWMFVVIVFPLIIWINVKFIKDQIRNEAKNDKKI